MFGPRGFSEYGRVWQRCGGRGGRGFGERGAGFGWGGHGMGGGARWGRVGRMLAQGDLRLVALALIAEEPRHGYEIIKVIEERTAGWYSPSPGVVYPTLTYLEEAGYVTAEADGAKRRYTITAEGRAHLEANRDLVDMVLDRLSAIGDKIARMRRMFGWGEGAGEGHGLPPLVEAALGNLREALAKRIGEAPDDEPRLVEILARAAGEIRRGQP